MKKVVTLFVAVLMIFALTACNNDATDTQKPSTSGESLYDMPDFSVPPSASGDTAKFTTQQVLELVNSTKVFSFDFADMLEKSKQTLYETKELKNGKEVEGTVSPLSLITFVLKYIDISSFDVFEASDFEVYDDYKMARMKEAKRPEEFMNCTITDIFLDLTDASLIIRYVYLIDEKNEASTCFYTTRLTYIGENQYKLFVRIEDYGESNGKEYVYITDEMFNFTANDYSIVDGTYACTQKTSLVYETTLPVSNSDKTITTLVKRAEIITVDIDIECENGIYTVDREMIMKQSDESYNPDDATEIYRINQHIEPYNGIYMLTETVKGTDVNNNPVNTTQYVTFMGKSA
jgi:hypothetical protein